MRQDSKAMDRAIAKAEWATKTRPNLMLVLAIALLAMALLQVVLLAWILTWPVTVMLRAQPGPSLRQTPISTAVAESDGVLRGHPAHYHELGVRDWHMQPDAATMRTFFDDDAGTLTVRYRPGTPEEVIRYVGPIEWLEISPTPERIEP